MNDRGQVVGSSDVPEGGQHAVLWHGTTITDLVTRRVHADALLIALDNRGDVAGTRNGHAVLYRR